MLDYAIGAAVAMAAGAVAAMTGFGIGSLLTPVLALTVDTRVAVAAVSIPHVIGTAVRFALLRGRIDRRVLLSFGLTSAAGGLAGASLYEVASSRSLNVVFGGLLLFAAISEATGLARRMRFRGWMAWAAGATSGLLGGLVGNQGGIRSAALIGFNLPKETFVATATAIALFVDGARLPIYLASQHDELLSLSPWIFAATIGVTSGTLVGSRALKRVPDVWFRRILAVTLATLGALMVSRAFRS
ncbi:MAG: sulfite exporter TauE/SafE family protein [Vicinamibacterales bacterium]